MTSRWFYIPLCLILWHGATFAENAVSDAKPTVREPLDSIVAVVNDDVITRAELDKRLRTIKKQLQQEHTPLPPDDVLEKQVLERLILTRIQLQLADKTGIRIDDDTLNRTLEKIAAENKLTISEFRKILEDDGVDFTEFREDMRDNIVLNRLRQRQVDDRIIITDNEIEAFLANQKGQGNSNEEYRVGHILIAVPDAATPEQIEAAKSKAVNTLDQLRSGADFRQTAIAVSNAPQALEGGDLGWRKAGELPTLFVDTVTKMKSGDISDLIRSPNGFHIIKLLEKRSTERHYVTQTLARHILIRTNELVSDEDAQQRLTQLRQRLLEGADFASLARTHSDDKATAVNGGSLNWTSPGDMVPQFETAMNALKENEISEPFKTRFGWHIVQVQQRRKQDDTDQFVRAQARDSIRERKTDEEYQMWLRQLRSDAYVEIR